MIYSRASFIVKTLAEEGYVAYFAGGWVRDYLLGSEANEIDIATDAPPEVVLALFPKTVSVGISFGVILVIIDQMQFEVSTFRRDLEYQDGRHPEGVLFSSPEEDAKRRDFTINGMFYDPLTKTLFDYVGGKSDLEKKIIRAIGDPEDRFREDRLRMMRAVRFSARFGFSIVKKTEDAIKHNARTLFPAVSMERIWQELCKMASFPNFDQALIHLMRLGLLQVIFPELEKISQIDIDKRVASFFQFPKETPTILFLIHLFPDHDLSFYIELCRRLKTSSEERKWVEFFISSQPLFYEKQDHFTWAHFYANPRSRTVLGIQLIILGKEHALTDEHQKREMLLAPHIKRIQTQSPLVTSSHLRELGIKPGRQMGELLMQAEKIAINHHLNSSQAVLAKLFEKDCKFPS
ncbi:MAG: CCA tRNA nucleotidyltransferase [Chlamydiia bacterium]|nr:CCA tRNA nucleotidyltransferase [Chlamydiia bacterium]